MVNIYILYGDEAVIILPISSMGRSYRNPFRDTFVIFQIGKSGHRLKYIYILDARFLSLK